MRKFIDRVTITGADDLTPHLMMLDVSKKYPFVEWGILLSKNSNGNQRFPDKNWLIELLKLWEEHPELILSGHICGSWTREICQGNWSILDDLRSIADMFARIQLNFHSYVHKIEHSPFLKGFEDQRLWLRQFIFQLDNVNNAILDLARTADIDAVPLFDLSGGTGVLPESWPTARKFYCGYAGGLSPDNLKEQLEQIEKVCGEGPIWIDVETHVRTNEFLDLDKVEKFLEIAKPYVL